MNDKAIGLIEQYEISVLRTYKGRGAVICETDKGLKQFRPFQGTEEKAAFQQQLIINMMEAGFSEVDPFERTKEGNYLVRDYDGTAYIVKDYIEGKECNVKNIVEVKEALRQLAHMHIAMKQPSLQIEYNLEVKSFHSECMKHNKELKKVQNFVRFQRQKTDFEIQLMQCYNSYYKKAIWVENRTLNDNYLKIDSITMEEGSFCHGDYQYHNVVMKPDGVAVVNFEKFVLGNKVRDIYLFMRKVLEKNNWSFEFGEEMLRAYEEITPLTYEEQAQLFDRFYYPEKFWKIVNFYYNSGKSWISGRNIEKLDKVKAQEQNKEYFLEIYAQRIHS